MAKDPSPKSASEISVVIANVGFIPVLCSPEPVEVVEIRSLEGYRVRPRLKRSTRNTGSDKTQKSNPEIIPLAIRNALHVGHRWQ